GGALGRSHRSGDALRPPRSARAEGSDRASRLHLDQRLGTARLGSPAVAAQLELPATAPAGRGPHAPARAHARHDLPARRRREDLAPEADPPLVRRGPRERDRAAGLPLAGTRGPRALV